MTKRVVPVVPAGSLQSLKQRADPRPRISYRQHLCGDSGEKHHHRILANFSFPINSLKTLTSLSFGLSLSASPTSILYSNYCHSLIEQLLLTLFITDPGRSFVSRRAPVASPFFNKLHIEIPSKADTERPRKTTSYQSECTPLLFHSCFYRLLWHTVIAMAQVTTTTSTTTLCPAAL